MDLGKGERTNNNNDNKNNKQRTMVVMMKEELHQEQEEVEDYCCAEPEQMTGSSFENDNKISGKKKKGSGVVLGSSSGKKSASSSGIGVIMGRCCQAENCTADLSDARQYHRRHKVCEQHAKAQSVLVAGLRQRFCQQCSRFHELSEFDETRRSCRKRLAGHNERRRKSLTETQAEGAGRRGTGTQLKDMACGGQFDDSRGRIQVAVQENATYKHFQIR